MPSTTDPIYAGIGAFNVAIERFKEAVAVQGVAEEKMFARRRAGVISETEKDADAVAAERASDVASDAVDDAARKIVEIDPVSIGGVVALLKFGAEQDYIMLPTSIDAADDGDPLDGECWHKWAMRNAADALSRLKV
jgi:hypothetical protein